MCLTQPINEVLTSYWVITDAMAQVEKLMEDAFEEKELWNEGDYLTYLQLLKEAWEHLENWNKPGCLKSTIDMINRAWTNSGASRKILKIHEFESYFQMVNCVVETFNSSFENDVDILSCDIYFIKCCLQYNTKKFIKKMKISDTDISNNAYFNKMIEAQDLDPCGPTADIGVCSKEQCLFGSGKKRYVWTQQTHHTFWDMNRVK